MKTEFGSMPYNVYQLAELILEATKENGIVSRMDAWGAIGELQTEDPIFKAVRSAGALMAFYSAQVIKFRDEFTSIDPTRLAERSVEIIRYRTFLGGMCEFLDFLFTHETAEQVQKMCAKKADRMNEKMIELLMRQGLNDGVRDRIETQASYEAFKTIREFMVSFNPNN